MLRSIIATAVLILGAALAGSTAAVAQGLVPCAPEHGFCRVPYPTRVVYGVPGRQVMRDVAGGGIPCSNRAFGDPAPGIPKRCAYIARSAREDFEPPFPHRPVRWRETEYGGPAWRTCADENGFCGFRGGKRVRYGAHGRYAEGFYRGGVGCNNGTFGDPVPGVPKHCQVLD